MVDISKIVSLSLLSPPSHSYTPYLAFWAALDFKGSPFPLPPSPVLIAHVVQHSLLPLARRLPIGPASFKLSRFPRQEQDKKKKRGRVLHRHSTEQTTTTRGRSSESPVEPWLLAQRVSRPRATHGATKLRSHAQQTTWAHTVSSSACISYQVYSAVFKWI